MSSTACSCAGKWEDDSLYRDGTLLVESRTYVITLYDPFCVAKHPATLDDPGAERPRQS